MAAATTWQCYSGISRYITEFPPSCAINIHACARGRPHRSQAFIGMWIEYAKQPILMWRGVW